MPQNPEGPAREGESWSRAEIDAAIADLDRATRMFSRQVDNLGVDAEAASPSERIPEQMPPGPSTAAPDSDPGGYAREQARTDADAETGAGEMPIARIDPETTFKAHMREAQREAEEYLEHAKRRADSLVNTMIGAVEREAAEIRQGAERGIRERWRAVEFEASRFLSDAKRVADNMVAERQERISELSDGIAGRAEALTRGMDDAERVRRQLEGFVRTLSQTADQIARQSSGYVDAEITRLRDPRHGTHRRAAAA